MDALSSIGMNSDARDVKRQGGGFQATVVLPVGRWQLGISTAQGAVTGVDFVRAVAAEVEPSDAVAAEAARQLRRYVDDSEWRFDLPLRLTGTDFQRRVWDALRRLRPGETRRYGQLAQQLGTSARAVGGACRANPVAIVVPCHRVIGSGGLGGFSGAVSGSEIELKEWLLRHEYDARRGSGASTEVARGRSANY
jgi:methylated-DNA-[protein]-cysteine S-methyltransferase